MPQPRSLHGLDWLNFFVANVQTGFGPFIAVYLTENRWTTAEIGYALTIGTICSLVSQVPAGALVDGMRDKRWAVWFGTMAISGTALMYAALADADVCLCRRGPAWPRQLGHRAGDRGGQPGAGRPRGVQRAHRPECALRLAGQRTGGGRDGSGRIIRVRQLGVLAHRRSRRAGADGIAHDREGTAGASAAAAEKQDAHGSLAGLKELFLDWRLLVFAACVVLFFVSNAAMLPLAATQITKRHPELADIIIAATIVIPQVDRRTAVAMGRTKLRPSGPTTDHVARLDDAPAAGTAVCQRADPISVDSSARC